ncbi:reverse transcriptase domain-containing protein [Tanacetum coccineum]
MLLTKTPKEIFALDKGKFKAPPPMTTPVEKRNHAKFCEFHGEVGHNIDECMHLKKQIKEMLKAGKLSHLIKELKHNNEKEQPKAAKKEESSGKDKALAILMVQPWERVARNKVHTKHFLLTQKFLYHPLGSVEAHKMLKALVEGGVITLKSSRMVPLECVMVSRPEGNLPATKQTVEERIKVSIHLEYPEQTIMVGSTLTKEGRNKFCSFFMREFHRVKEGEKTRDVVLGFEKGGKNCFGFNRKGFGVMAKLAPHCYLRFCKKGIQANEAANSRASHVSRANGKGGTYRLFDSSKRDNGSGVGLILTNPEGMEFTYALRFRFGATNNEAEYEALIAGLRIAEQMGVKNLHENVDSQLVANQVNETYVAKEADMIRYLEKVRTLTSSFKAFSIRQVPRSENKKADALSKIASTSFAHLSKQVLVEELKEKSISEVEILAVVEEEGDTWMTPIFEYLTEETLPADVKEARAVRRKSRRFAVINGTLYKKSFLGPWLRCVGPLQANYVLREIHEGSCSMHADTRSVVAKSLRIGYYWPTMHKDARTLIRACQDCQVHKPVSRNPQQKLTPITSPWPFYKWGIDIAGPFPEGPGKVKFLIVAIDYFTKCIEAKPVATITGNQIKKFAWENIVCRFGLPGEIISDNGKQFKGNLFKDWCEKLCIRQHFASVKHPQTNGMVERANHSLGEGIKARLDARSKNWMEELSHVLWAHRTMIKSNNGDTPFSLTYGIEAVIPTEIGMPALRTAEVDLVQNNEALEINLDLLDEKKEQAAIREAKSKAKMEKYYNSKVRSASFKPGDLVYRNNDASRAKDTGKLVPK